MRWPLVLLVFLAACSLPPPAEVVLSPEGAGELLIREEGSWYLELPPWLSATPSFGTGAGRVLLLGRPERLPDLPRVVGEVWVNSGDTARPVRVVWPLLRVEGLVTAAAGELPAAGLGTSRPPAPKERLAKVGSRLLVLKEGDPVPPGAEWVEENGYVWPLGEPEDPYYPLEGHLFVTGARHAYLAEYSREVVVAVIDTGVRYDHPDLAGVLLSGAKGAYDFVEDDADPTDPGPGGEAGSHGTHVTGIVAARANGEGVVGLAWPAPVKILPLRVISESGYGTFKDVADAIRYAAGLPVERGDKTLVNPNPAQVINLSLGGTTPSLALCEAVAEAEAAGALVVAAAGNALAGREVYFYPAACEGALAVAATDLGGWRPPLYTWYSARNDRVDLAAPGGDLAQDLDGNGYPDGILSTTWNYEENAPSYGFYMGTSQAAPQVAAAAALLLSSGRADTPKEAEKLLLATATDLGPSGPDPDYGAGLLNLPTALGITPPPGKTLVYFQGPTPRSLRVEPYSPFVTHLAPGDYRVLVCRDDSENGLCDPGEPTREHFLKLTGDESLRLFNPVVR